MDLSHVDKIINSGMPHVAERIFDSLSVNDLKHCQKVSKMWKVLSEKMLTEKILFQWKGKLLEACKKGEKDVVRILLENEDDIDLNATDSRDWYFRTPFAWACTNSHEAVADLLVNHPGFEVDTVDQVGNTNLIWASKMGFNKTVRILLSKMEITAINEKCNSGRTALMHAIIKLHESVADQLLNVEGIDIDSVDKDGKTCLMWAAANGLDQTVQKLLPMMSITDINKKGNSGKTALMYAQTDSIADQLLNSEGIQYDNVDNHEKTSLMCAIGNGLEQTVKRLLTKLSITDINKQERFGETALMYAIKQRNESVVDQLLNLEGIEVDSVDTHGMTCLMLASMYNLEQIVVKLLPKISPESIKKCQQGGWNAFIFACKNNSDKVLELMFAKSPLMNWDFNAQNRDGYTGFIRACKDKEEKAVDLILANYQRLKIDLNIKDNLGRTGMDFWPEKFDGMTIEDV